VAILVLPPRVSKVDEMIHEPDTHTRMLGRSFGGVKSLKTSDCSSKREVLRLQMFIDQ
jgi:hypothetical protein